MEVQFGPNSVDESNLLYKLQRKIKVFNTSNPLPNRGYNLVTSSSKYAIVFVASPDGILSAYHLTQLIDKECEPQHLLVKLQERPTHIAVSCDQELLAVTGGQLLCVYKVTDFQNQIVSPSINIKCDVNPSAFVCALQWNPCIPNSIAIAFFDGTLLVSQVTSGQIKKVQSKARCICWSPKGKQLVTGNSDGTLCQYKPDLTPAKLVPAPNLFSGAPVEALAVYWISTFQFTVVYRNASDNSRPTVTIVNTPKAGQPSCINYEDICYSMGSNRPWYYYLQGIAPWNIVQCSSSNSMEIATLGSPYGALWFQWCQPDEARPELPLTDKKQENYPVGLWVDTCAIHQLPWESVRQIFKYSDGNLVSYDNQDALLEEQTIKINQKGENEFLPHMPLLLVVSQSGLLTIFNVINVNEADPQLCTPPQPLALPAAAMTSEIPGVAPDPPSQPVQIAASISQPKPQPVQEFPQPLPQLPQPIPQLPQPVSQLPQPVTQLPQPIHQLPQPVPQLPQPVPQLPQPVPQLPQPVQQSAQAFQAATSSKQAFQQQPSQEFLPSFQQQQPNRAFSAVATPQASEQRQEVKPVINVPQPPPVSVQPKPATKPSQAQEVNAALKAEQERMNKLKADQELRNMLVKEVNDFQMELYKFLNNTRNVQVNLQRELESIDPNLGLHNLDTEQLKKECSLDELRGAIVELKLELVRACAVVAEARTHAEAKELHQWTQADPLTTKRVASVKKLAYYVQTQLEQAQKSLDYKWNEMALREPQYNKPGQRMIRPILDDVYQPLVKQQEILGRQQAVLRTLRNTLKECDPTPMSKSTSLLRSTPFKNKDPLSKLTKNILNMSIEPDTKNTKEPLLTPHKLDALRDMLSNHRPVKIKPVNVELSQHLAALRLSYEKSVKEKAAQAEVKQKAQEEERKEKAALAEQQNLPAPIQVPIKTIHAPVKPVQIRSQPAQPVKVEIVKPESKPDLISKQMPISVPSFTPVNIMKTPSVARTLFTDEPKQDHPKAHQQPSPAAPKAQHPQSTAAFAPPAPATVTENTRSVLKDMLQNKQANAEAKSNANTFMGQKICLPTTSAFTSPGQAPTVSFTSKPISDINNMFSKFTPPTTVTPQPKPVSSAKPRSDETGEPEITDKQAVKTKEQKPLTNLFGLATTSTPLPASTKSVPDVLKSNFTVVKAENKPFPVEKVSEKSKENIKENVQEKSAEKTPQSTTDSAKEHEAKPLTLTSNKSAVFASVTPSSSTISTSVTTASSDSPKPTETEDERKAESPELSGISDSSASSNASSLFAAANASAAIVSKPHPVLGTLNLTTTSQPPSLFGSPTPSLDLSTNKGSDTPTTASASFIFGTAVASQPASFGKTTASGSIFTSTTKTTSSVFGASSQGSIFGTATTTSSPQSLFGSATTQSVFTGTSAKSSVFSTPTPASPTSASPTSVFATTSPTSSSVFASPPASVFSTAASTTFGPPSPSVFGSTGTTTQSIFGTATTTTTSIFGSPVSTTQTIFGSKPPTTTQASLFGNGTNQAASIFGSAVANQTSSVFASTTPTTQTPVFGATTQASVFGSTTPSTQTSVFGSPTPTSVFGSPQTTQASVFGTPPTTTVQSGSLFGGAESNLFAAASISTTNASPSPTSGGNIFGGSSSGSVFGGGSNTNVFGGKSSFGQSNPTAASIFGGAAAATNFGQKPAANFWSGANASAGSAFGSPAFGQQATTQASSIFAGGSSGSFSAPSSQPFGTPPQQQSVFGSPPQQQAGGFGGAPAFGSSPGFGQSAGAGFGSSFGGFNKSPSSGFGAPAAFGSGATFGGSAFGSTSPGKGFSNAAAPATGFGSPTQSNATFENLATQNTLTFGNLAQQSGQPARAPQAPAFNTSPSFTGWRG